MGYGILIVIGLFVVVYLYTKIKEKAKQNIFFKEQYETQKALTERSYVYHSAADAETIKTAIKKHIPTDDSFAANLKGGNYTIEAETPDSITYLHGAKITTGGGGDQFTANVTIRQNNGVSEITAQILRWRVHDGVTRKAGIQAMQDFYDRVRLAVMETEANAT